MAEGPGGVDQNELLQREINSYVRKGFHVVSQTDATAQLLRPKKFSFWWALLWFLFFGVGLLIYMLYFLSKKDETVYLEVSPDGRVSRRTG